MTGDTHHLRFRTTPQAECRRHASQKMFIRQDVSGAFGDGITEQWRFADHPRQDRTDTVGRTIWKSNAARSAS
jgi:hypothetical protein